MTPLFTQNGDSGHAPRSFSWPLALLAHVDMMTLTRDYAPLLSEPPEQNRWFVMRGTEALPPESFHEVLSRLARGEGPLTVLRESEAEQNPAPWYTLDYQASVSNRATALAVIVGFWVVVMFLGWVIVATVSPRESSGLWQTAYIVAAVAVVAWLSLPPRGRGAKRKAEVATQAAL